MNQYRETTLSFRENHQLNVVHVAAISELGAETENILIATAGMGQANIYDNNYCSEGLMDLIAQLPLTDSSDRAVQATVCAWINVPDDLLLAIGDETGCVRIVSFTRLKEVSRWVVSPEGLFVGRSRGND
ncbi:hypothetical protein HDU98_012141 [Podochytrium sp. JEL0797]|nr:hypothetical protein HDU98_012141 [Podochytrium sp. JEL0797]